MVYFVAWIVGAFVAAFFVGRIFAHITRLTPKPPNYK